MSSGYVLSRSKEERACNPVRIGRLTDVLDAEGRTREIKLKLIDTRITISDTELAESDGD